MNMTFDEDAMERYTAEAGSRIEPAYGRERTIVSDAAGAAELLLGVASFGENPEPYQKDKLESVKTSVGEYLSGLRDRTTGVVEVTRKVRELAKEKGFNDALVDNAIRMTRGY